MKHSIHFPAWPALAAGLLLAGSGGDPTWIDAVTAATVINTPPRLSLVPASANLSVVEGRSLTITAVGTDIYDDPLRYDMAVDAAAIPEGIVWNPATGVFVWTPPRGAATAAPLTVTFTVTDQPSNGTEPASAAKSVTITVVADDPATNRLPVFDPIVSPQTLLVGEDYQLAIAATDADDDTLRLTANGLTDADDETLRVATGLPRGADFLPVGLVDGKWTGVLRWKPGPAQANTRFTLRFRAGDGYSALSAAERDVVFEVGAAAADASLKKLVIGQAQWRGKTASLVVRGNLAPAKGTRIAAATRVALFDADTLAPLGAARVKKSGQWRFAASLTALPCRVRAESGGRSATRTVKRTPAGSCGGQGG